jgi:NADH:ubiquinone oxidoreductase subunit 3 (subunit A)
MNNLLMLFIFVPILVFILLFLNFFFAPIKPDNEKLSPFECGFSPVYGQTRNNFNIQFFLVSLFFLIFDLEILLLFPIAVSLYQVGFYGLSIAIIFFLILTIGFIVEIAMSVIKLTDSKTGIPLNEIINSPKPFKK